MVFGDLLSINDRLGHAYFICWDSDSRLVLAQLNLNERPDFYSDLLKPGIRVSCSLTKTNFEPYEIYEVSSFEIVDIPICAVKSIHVTGASVVHKDKSSKTAYVLCHIPALSILSEFHFGQWFYAPEEITVLAHLVTDVKNIVIGQKVDVNIEYSTDKKSSNKFVDGTWKVTRLQMSENASNHRISVTDTNYVVDVLEKPASHCDDYVALNVISCIARTDFHMYLVVEIVDWTSPDAKLKVQLPKEIPLRGTKTNETQTLEVGMCLISFFSRSRDQGWTHLFSEMFDSYYWVCGKSADGFHYLDLQAIAEPEPTIRKFDQRRCSECLERLVSPQLLSTFSTGLSRKLNLVEQNASMTQNLELGYQSREYISPSSPNNAEQDETSATHNHYSLTPQKGILLEESPHTVEMNENPKNSSLKVSTQIHPKYPTTSKIGLEIESDSDSDDLNLTRPLNSTFLEENLGANDIINDTCTSVNQGWHLLESDSSQIKVNPEERNKMSIDNDNCSNTPHLNRYFHINDVMASYSKMAQSSLMPDSQKVDENFSVAVTENRSQSGPGLIPQPVFDPYMQQQQPISYQMPAPLLVPQNSNVAEGLYTLSLAHSPSHMSTTSLSKPFVPSLSKSFASLPLNHSLASGSDGTSDQISGNSRSIFHDLAKTSKEFVPRIQSPKDNTTNTSSQKSSTIRETSLGHGKRFDPSKPLFREVRLTTDGDLIHVANISGRPMVLSAEISGLIPRWNGDILGKMLKVIGEQKLTQVYKRDESTVELFQQCLIHSLPGICIGDTDDIVDSLTFYRLADVPRILQKFKPQLKTELYQAVMREIENFDPNDLYWSGEQEI